MDIPKREEENVLKKQVGRKVNTKLSPPVTTTTINSLVEERFSTIYYLIFLLSKIVLFVNIFLMR